MSAADRVEPTLRERFVGGAGWSLASAIASRGTALLGAIVAGQLLGATGFGELAILQATIELLAVPANIGLGLTATRHIAISLDEPSRGAQVAGVAIVGAAGAGVILSAVLWLSAPLVAGSVLGAPHLAGELRIATLLVILGALHSSIFGSLAGLEDFRTIARLAAVRGFGGALLLVAGLLTEGLAGGLIGWSLAEGLSALYGYRLLRGRFLTLGVPIPFRGLADSWPLLRSFALPAVMASLVTLPAMWAARVLLIRLPDGYGHLGIYTAALKWAHLVLFVPTAVGSIALPMLARSHGRGDRAATRWILRTNLASVAGLCLLPSLGVAALARPLMGVFGGEYISGWPVLVILALSATPMALNTVLGQALVSDGRIWLRFGFDLLLALLLIGLAWWFVPRWQATGLAVAYAGAYSVTAGCVAASVWHGRTARERAHRQKEIA